MRNAGTLRAGGIGTQQQGRASSLRETGLDEDSVLGRLRTEGGYERYSGGMSADASVAMADAH